MGMPLVIAVSEKAMCLVNFLPDVLDSL